MRIVYRLLGMAIAFTVASMVGGDGTLDAQTMTTIRVASIPIGWALAALFTPRPDEPPQAPRNEIPRHLIGAPGRWIYCPSCGRGNFDDRSTCWRCGAQLKSLANSGEA